MHPDRSLQSWLLKRCTQTTADQRIVNGTVTDGMIPRHGICGLMKEFQAVHGRELTNMSQAPFEGRTPYNKNKIVLLCVIGVLIVLVLSIVLISNTGGVAGGATESSDAEQKITDTVTETDDSTASEETDENGTAGKTETTEPPFFVEQTVSDKRYEEEDETQPAKPDSGTQPAKPETDTTQPSTEATLPATTPSGPVRISYAQWLELTPKQQSEYFKQFADPEDYITWLDNAKKEYEEDRSEIIATGEVDLGKLP